MKKSFWTTTSRAVAMLLGAMTMMWSAQAQDANDGLLLKKRLNPIVIDGEITESDWFSGQKAHTFWDNFPSDSVRSHWQTEVYMTYDNQYLYIAAKCEAPAAEYVVPSLRRDYRAGGSDNITFVLDPFRDRTNAFVFGMNPYGVMREALISNGGRTNADFSEFWDNIWRGESKIYDNYWSCELAIPLSTLRYPPNSNTWFFNCYRFDTQSNTRSTWQRIPQNQIIMSLAYMGRMEWETPPRAQGSPVSVIPYVAAGAARDFETEPSARTAYGIGLDAKIALSSGVNLDLTVNPDFSQVEVDRQVVNLDRFELFFPERRQFFLENADLFGSFGDERANPFFSRRIGITQDTATGQALSNRIFYGARLSGKLNENWRLGLLNMQTARNEANGLPSYNYTVGVLQRKVFSRSNLGLIVVNKQTFDDPKFLQGPDNQRYNRVLGIDYNLASSDNRWLGKAWFHHSLSSVQADSAYSYGSRLSYRVRRYELGVEQRGVGSGFVAETGFVPRANFWQGGPFGQLFFYPAKGPITRHGPGFRSRLVYTPRQGNTDQFAVLFWDFQCRNNSFWVLRYTHEYIYLLDDFDPTRTDALPLPAGSDYRYSQVSATYESDRRRTLSGSLESAGGRYFNGWRYGFDGDLTWRYQPYGQVALQLSYNYISLPAPYATASLFLVGPRIDFTFSRSLFLTVFLQYNNQIDNFNINARLQWRFAPVSDVFLVYTDNYDTAQWGIKNRALVLKATYWLNL